MVARAQLPADVSAEFQHDADQHIDSESLSGSNGVFGRFGYSSRLRGCYYFYIFDRINTLYVCGRQDLFKLIRPCPGLQLMESF